MKSFDGFLGEIYKREPFSPNAPARVPQRPMKEPMVGRFKKIADRKGMNDKDVEHILGNQGFGRKSMAMVKNRKPEGAKDYPIVKKESLDEALNFDASFPDVWSALEHVNSIAEQYGVSLPEIEELDNDEFGEEVFQVEEDAYLYFCYALNEQGEYDIVSGVFNSSELDELLSEEE